jgi:SAM-dependent methyltransferase
MKEEDKSWIIDRYDARYKKFGNSIKTLASGMDERRQMRFDMMTGVGIEDRDSVLDLGCGFGDYLDYLNSHNIKANYTGYDINPTLIAEAKKRFSDEQFEVKDVVHDEWPEFDYIISSSCFNLPLKSQDNYEFIAQLLQSAYDHSRKGVAIDLLSSYVDFKSEEGFHYEPEKIFSIAKNITKKVCLRHDYPLFEFTIYLYKDFDGWGTGK